MGIPLLEITSLLNLLRGAVLEELFRAEADISVRLTIPATSYYPEKTLFGTFEHCQEFNLQPIKNDRTLISNLEQITTLKLVIHSTESAGIDKFKIHCSFGKSEDQAALHIRANAFHLYDENFDRLQPADLMQLEGKLDGPED